MKQRVGELLKFLREQKKLKQEKLCLGLCLRNAYSKIESGTQLPDCLLLQALAQRLGKSGSKFSGLLSEEEYIYFSWKRSVLQALYEESYEEVEQLLEEANDIEEKLNENLHNQFLYQVKALLAEYQGKSAAYSIEMMRKAIECTMPDIENRDFTKYVIGLDEMQLLVLLAEFLIEGEEYSTAKSLLQKSIDYIETYYDDYEIRVKVYPRAVKLFVTILEKEGHFMEGALLSQKSIALLCWNGVLFDLVELIHLYLKCRKNFPEDEQVIRYRKQVQALEEIYEAYDRNGYMRPRKFSGYGNQELYLLNEVIQQTRLSQELSQEELSDGICASETLSRIETGKRSPSRKNFYAIMEKLGTGLGYYNGVLDTDNFAVLEKHYRMVREIGKNNYENAYKLLCELKEEADLAREKNKRELGLEEKMLLHELGKVSLEEYRKSCEEYMNCPNEIWREEKFWKQFFTLEKVIAMNYLALSYSEDRRREEAIFIWEHLLEKLKNSKVALRDRYKSSITLMGNLSSEYGEVGEFKKCIAISEEGLQLCLECGRGNRVGKFLGNKSEARNIEENTFLKQSKEDFERAYYITDMLGVPMTKKYVDTYYRKSYDKDVQWY